MNRRSFITRTAIAAAAAVAGVLSLPARPASGRAKVHSYAKTPVPYDVGALERGWEPNPEYVTAVYEVVLMTWDGKEWHRYPITEEQYRRIYGPPVRGNCFDSDGNLIPIYPHRLKNV